MSIYIAIGGGVGGLLVLVVVIIIIYVTCKNRSRPNDPNGYDVKKDIDPDDGFDKHMDAAECYISVKTETMPANVGKQGRDGKHGHSGPIFDGGKKGTERDGQRDEDDYDEFGKPDRADVSPCYDHVPLRSISKQAPDDLEDYDYIPGAEVCGIERTEIDSMYDHAQKFMVRDRNVSTSSNYDHIMLMEENYEKGYSLQRTSDDYDHTSNVSKIEIADGGGDSYYMNVAIPYI